MGAAVVCGPGGQRAGGAHWQRGRAAQGERGHQQQSHDAGPLPGGPALEPAAPPPRAPPCPLPRIQGMPVACLLFILKESLRIVHCERQLLLFAQQETRGGTGDKYGIRDVTRAYLAEVHSKELSRGMTQVTHLFRDVLHGWGQILLCVNVSPAARDYDETARVLRYAALATQIGTAARAEPPLRVLKCASDALATSRR